TVEVDDAPAGPAGHRLLAVRGHPRIGQGEVDLRFGGDVGELPHAQEGHGAHGHTPGLEHGEPAGGEHRMVRPAEQHTVAGNDPEVFHQNVSDAVGGLQEVAIGPAAAV